MPIRKSTRTPAMLIAGIGLMIAALACEALPIELPGGSSALDEQTLIMTRVALAVAQTQIALAQQAAAATPAPPAPLTAPTAPPGKTIEFGGASFFLSPSIAEDAWGEITPSNGNLGDEDLFGGWIPAHLSFTFSGYVDQFSDYRATIGIYSVDELLQDSAMEDYFFELETLIAQQNLAPAGELPDFPRPPAGHLIEAKRAFVQAAGGTGIRYLTMYAQDLWPIHNLGLIYRFVGISADGRSYISATFPVSHASLPYTGDGSEILDWDQFYDNWDSYILQLRQALNAQPPGSFTPNLQELDRLLRSLATP